MIKTSDRLDWAIEQKAMWIATHKNGATLVALTRNELNRKINQSDKKG